MTFRLRHILFRAALSAASLFFLVPAVYAHSGKARFHAIIDTDGAADDLRTLCMLLGNREVEVLAVTTSEGALPPAESAASVQALLDGFYHEGVPVGAGHPTGAAAPVWRTHSRQVDWGDTLSVRTAFPPAQALIAETLEDEEEKVFFIALGALTNVCDALRENPALGDRIDRIVWYNNQAEPLAGANFEADSVAARAVLASGVPVAVVSANPACPLVVTPSLLDSIAAVPTVYARKIADTHRAAPLAKLVDAGHLQAWDDLVAVWLFAPELFVPREVSGSVTSYSLPDEASAGGGRLKSLPSSAESPIRRAGCSTDFRSCTNFMPRMSCRWSTRRSPATGRASGGPGC